VVGAAALTFLAYPPAGVWPLAFVMQAPLVAALSGAGPGRAFALAWAYSVAMGVALGTFVIHAFTVEYGLPAAPAWLFLLGLVGVYAAVPALAAAGFAAIAGRSDAGAWQTPLAFAACWTLGEWLRAEPLGLPWLLLAHAVVPFPEALQSAEWGGAYLPGFAIACVNAGVAQAVGQRRLVPLAAPAALSAALALHATVSLAREFAGGEPLRVALVQASVPQRERFVPGSALRHAVQYAEMTLRHVASEPAGLVVWSETAIDGDFDATPEIGPLLESLATRVHAPIVTGAPRSKGGRPANSVLLFAPLRGLVEIYEKQKLVPFSEYDPPYFAWLEPLLGPVTAGTPYLPGASPTVLRSAPIPFAAPVCFEVTDPGLMRRFRLAGAALFVNLSNDAWFGKVGYPELHFGHAVLRAIELRSFVVRGANTGISGVVDPHGRVAVEIAAFASGTASAEVRAAGVAPFYARHGSAPVVAGVAVAAAGLLVTARGAGRASLPGRTRPGPPAARPPGRGSRSTRSRASGPGA
jgi:apolipoprotein N-acyltransferase